jgi:hypothetical protein
MRWLAIRSEFNMVNDITFIPADEMKLILPTPNFSQLYNSNTGQKMTRQSLTGAGLLNVDHLASFLICQSNPGTFNYTHGIVMDHALWVERPTVFAYGLGRLLSSSNKEGELARARFIRLFALVAALPNFYRDT